MRLILMPRRWVVPLLLIVALAAAAPAVWRAVGGPREAVAPTPPQDLVSEFVEDRAVAPGGESFYVDCRVDRERSRGRQVEYLRTIIDDPNAANEERRRAQSELLRITREIERETSTENILRARGFVGAAVIFQGRAVTVVVPRVLNLEERNSVTNLVARGTGVSCEEIMIIDLADETTKAGS